MATAKKYFKIGFNIFAIIALTAAFWFPSEKTTPKAEAMYKVAGGQCYINFYDSSNNTAGQSSYSGNSWCTVPAGATVAYYVVDALDDGGYVYYNGGQVNYYDWTTCSIKSDYSGGPGFAVTPGQNVSLGLQAINCGAGGAGGRAWLDFWGPSPGYVCVSTNYDASTNYNSPGYTVQSNGGVNFLYNPSTYNTCFSEPSTYTYTVTPLVPSCVSVTSTPPTYLSDGGTIWFILTYKMTCGTVTVTSSPSSTWTLQSSSGATWPGGPSAGPVNYFVPCGYTYSIINPGVIAGQTPTITPSSQALTCP